MGMEKQLVLFSHIRCSVNHICVYTHIHTHTCRQTNIKCFGETEISEFLVEKKASLSTMAEILWLHHVCFIRCHLHEKFLSSFWLKWVI